MKEGGDEELKRTRALTPEADTTEYMISFIRGCIVSRGKDIRERYLLTVNVSVAIGCYYNRCIT